MKDFAIVDARGFEQARVLYPELAEEIADRYTNDPAMAGGAPYSVSEVDAPYTRNLPRRY